MKSFSQFIKELFDRPARWKLVVDDSDHFIPYLLYVSDIKGKKLEVSFDMLDDKWSVQFQVDGSTEITGEGGEMTIFSTVLDIISDFIQRIEPETFYFSADKSYPSGRNSRIRLYNRLIRRFAGDHGYRLQSKEDKGSHALYTLTKM